MTAPGPFVDGNRREARRLFEQEHCSVRYLAARFGVSEASLKAIIRREGWRAPQARTRRPSAARATTPAAPVSEAPVADTGANAAAPDPLPTSPMVAPHVEPGGEGHAEAPVAPAAPQVATGDDGAGEADAGASPASVATAATDEDRRHATADWPTEAIALLRCLWASGLSTSRIGQEMRRSKSAVTGKAYRIGLPRRDDPIEQSRRLAAVKQSGARPRARRLAEAPLRTSAERQMDTILGQARRLAAPAVLTSRDAAVAPVRYRTCQWPMNDGEPEWLFCGRDRDPTCRLPYCTDHAARAFANAEKPDAEDDE